MNDDDTLILLEKYNAFPKYISKEDCEYGRRNGKKNRIIASLSKTHILEFSKSIDHFLDNILVCPEEFLEWFKREFRITPKPLKELVYNGKETTMDRFEKALRENGAIKIKTNSTGEKEKFRDIFIISFHNFGNDKKYLHNTELSKMICENFLPEFKESALRVEVAQWKER